MKLCIWQHPVNYFADNYRNEYYYNAKNEYNITTFVLFQQPNGSATFPYYIGNKYTENSQKEKTWDDNRSNINQDDNRI